MQSMYLSLYADLSVIYFVILYTISEFVIICWKAMGKLSRDSHAFEWYEFKINASI